MSHTATLDGVAMKEAVITLKAILDLRVQLLRKFVEAKVEVVAHQWDEPTAFTTALRLEVRRLADFPEGYESASALSVCAFAGDLHKNL